MLRSFTAAVLLSLTAALAAPASGMAQGAGDQQYADPLAGDDGGGGGGGENPGGNSGAGSGSGGNSGSGSSTPSTNSQSQDTAPAPQAEATAAPQSGSQLPRTGYPAWLAALAGGVLLASGATLRLSSGRRT